MPPPDGDVSFAVSDIGGRAEMEDEHVLEVDSVVPLRVLGCVFDGHGGVAVARLAKERFPALFREALRWGPEVAFRRVYAAVQKEAEELHGGSVAATFYVEGDEVTVANTGDSQIVAVSGDRARTLTDEHRLRNPAEWKRVIEAGGIIQGPYVCLPNGRGIMPTRTLGDHAFHAVGVLADPVVSTHHLGPGFLVAACDGLWDVVEPAELPALLRGIGTAEAAGNRLAKEALGVRQTGDNLTVLVVRVGAGTRS